MTLTLTVDQPTRAVAEIGSNALPEIAFTPPPRWKRAIDVVGSLVLLVVLSPLMVLIAIHIRIWSPGPIFFRQERIGGGANPFVIHKFRTMTIENDGEEHHEYVARMAKLDQPIRKPLYDRRLIIGGALLRKLSLDELPQLFDVLVGKMSLVGPRPDVLNLENYEPWQLRRFEVLPGISGLWQVSGKNRLTHTQMCHLDLQYIDQFSFWMDLKIMLRTVLLILTQSNE